MNSNNYVCPNCHKSYYQLGITKSTAMYFPPVYKDGVNINPDRNYHTTECLCLNCNHYFTVQDRGGEDVTYTLGAEYKSTPIISENIVYV